MLHQAREPAAETTRPRPHGGRIERLRALCRSTADRDGFQRAILAIILVNAALMGLETSSSVVAAHGDLLSAAGVAVQALFVAEIAIRLSAHRPLSHFFRDGWNVFDFSVVAASLLPAVGPLATVVRLARVLRVARLVSVSPDLRLIIATMLRSIPSMGHVILLLSLLLYVYAILGFHWFGKQDPSHWGTLGTALLSLFQILTLEGWPEMQEAVMTTRPWAWIYFASFVVIAVFVVINLFIAVVINNLQTIKAESQPNEAAAHPQADLLRCIAVLSSELDRLETLVCADEQTLRRVYGSPSAVSGDRHASPATASRRVAANPGTDDPARHL